MKPFNLERALAGDPVITRSGIEVLQLAYFPAAEAPFQLVVLLEGEWSPMHCYSQGYFRIGEENAVDLFMAPKTEKVFVNIWRYGDDGYRSYVFTEESCAAGHFKTYKHGLDFVAVAKEIEIEIEV